MKIIDVQAYYLKLPKIQARTDSSQDSLIIKIETDAEITGWGEVDSCPWVIKAIIDAPMSHTLVNGLRNILIDQNPLDTGYLWNLMYQKTLYFGRSGAVIQAMAGIDLALWDIKGKFYQQPVWRLIGGRYREKLRVYSSNMFQFTPEKTADRISFAKDQGFTAAKFGWEPFGENAQTDCKYLDAMRLAAGEDFDLMLDIGCIWDSTTTIQRCKLFESYNLLWIEEPLAPDDLCGYRSVSKKISQRLAAGEEECTFHGFRNLIDIGGISLAQIDLTRCGLTQALKIADYADSRGILVANHNFTTDLNTAASLTFLSAIPNALVLEYCVEPSEISRNLALEPFKQVDGFMQVPESPGLGFEPNLNVMEKYMVKSLD